MSRKNGMVLTTARALMGMVGEGTGTPYDAFTRGTPMGEHWASTLVVTPLPEPKTTRKSGKSRRQRRVQKAGGKR